MVSEAHRAGVHPAAVILMVMEESFLRCFHSRWWAPSYMMAIFNSGIAKSKTVTILPLTINGTCSSTVYP